MPVPRKFQKVPFLGSWWSGIAGIEWKRISGRKISLGNSCSLLHSRANRRVFYGPLEIKAFSNGCIVHTSIHLFADYNKVHCRLNWSNKLLVWGRSHQPLRFILATILPPNFICRMEVLKKERKREKIQEVFDCITGDSFYSCLSCQ